MARAKNTGEYNIIGNKYGLLTVLETNSINGRMYAVCICECGNTKIVRRDTLMGRNVLSCGCIQDNKISERNNLTKVTREQLKNKQIPFIYAVERLPEHVIHRIMKSQKLNIEQATKKYKEWRQDYRKGIERDII